jgi:hypothetical protein
MSEIINWLRKPQSYWLWVDIGQNQYEGPLLNLRVLLSQKDVDTFIELETEVFAFEDYELVKVKTDLNELTDSFLEKFLYRSQFPRKQIISFQRYRGKKGDRYLTTYYLFEVKAHDY